MTDLQDIIGIVKEIRAKHDDTKYLYCVEETASDRAELHAVGQEAVHLARLHNWFPTIAEALLIAVDELERIADNDHMDYDHHSYGEYGKGIADGHRCAAKWADKALAHIKSLPTQ